MSRRVLKHIIFWFCFVSLYVLVKMFFVAPSDEKYSFGALLLRYYFSEIAFLPWKAIPFYFLFYYLLPKYLADKSYVKLSLYFLLIIFLCLIGYRSFIEPVSLILYGEEVDFNVFSLSRILYSFTDILPAIALASSAKLLKGSIDARKRQQTLEKEKQQAELNYLKAQTNPHFLFNTLNNLYGLARRNDVKTADSILKLSNMMRYILYECEESMNPLSSEVALIENYIELQKLRYDDSLQLEFTKDIDDEEYALAPLVLLSFVENAFKHGASENRNGTLIKIRLELKDQTLRFRISNTKDGSDSSGDGIGLNNVKRQLELLYGSRHELDIFEGEDEYNVNLFIHPDSYGR